MARAKLFAGAAIGLCYFLVSFILLGHRNTASSVIVQRGYIEALALHQLHNHSGGL